jgi:hypothetical protein
MFLRCVLHEPLEHPLVWLLAAETLGPLEQAHSTPRPSRWIVPQVPGDTG